MIVNHSNALSEIKRAKTEAKRYCTLAGYYPTGNIKCGQFIEFTKPVPISEGASETVSFFQFYDVRSKEFIGTGELFRRVRIVPAYRRKAIEVGFKKWMKE